MIRLVLFAAGVFALGCGGNPSPMHHPARHDPDAGHSHDRGKMKLADAGPYHAALTAHLSSKDGNELDIFFEAMNQPEPVPLAIAGFTAKAHRAGDGKEFTLEFVPTPKDERKDDPDGKCSHFVAKAPWMGSADLLTVTTTLHLAGKDRVVEWADFNPKKYAHHED